MNDNDRHFTVQPITDSVGVSISENGNYMVANSTGGNGIHYSLDKGKTWSKTRNRDSLIGVTVVANNGLVMNYTSQSSPNAGSMLLSDIKTNSYSLYNTGFTMRSDLMTISPNGDIAIMHHTPNTLSFIRLIPKN